MRKKVILAAVGAVLAVGIGATFWLTASGPAPVNNSAQAIRMFEKQVYRDSSYTFEWTSNAIGANSDKDIKAEFTCPATSTSVFVFLSLRGKESSPDSGWQAFAQSAFWGHSTNVMTPNLKPSGLINGNPGARYIRDLGGDYSLGIACTQNQGKLVDAVSYRFIHIEAHTGRWSALPEPTIKSPN